jgi:hypothetical protein
VAHNRFRDTLTTMPSLHPFSRLLAAIGAGLVSAVVLVTAIAGALVAGALFSVHSAKSGDLPGLLAFMAAIPVQLLVGTLVSWYALGPTTVKPLVVWFISAASGFALLALVAILFGGHHHWEPAEWREVGLAVLGLAVGGAVPALIARLIS